MDLDISIRSVMKCRVVRARWGEVTIENEEGQRITVREGQPLHITHKIEEHSS